MIIGCEEGICEIGYRNTNISNTTTKEIVVDSGRRRSKPGLVTIQGDDTEIVSSHKYLGTDLDNKDWTTHIKVPYKVIF